MEKYTTDEAINAIKDAEAIDQGEIENQATNPDSPSPTLQESPSPTLPAGEGESGDNYDREIEGKVDYEALIAEAEERGYLRGRNERIEEIMKMPEATTAVESEECEILILNNLKPSVWERE